MRVAVRRGDHAARVPRRRHRGRALEEALTVAVEAVTEVGLEMRRSLPVRRGLPVRRSLPLMQCGLD